MRLSHQDVEHVARLARLRLTPQERERMVEVLSSVLAHMEVLGDGVSSERPLSTDRVNAFSGLREDRPSRTEAPERLLALGPNTRAGQFSVPRIVQDA
jgi:aspartyl-tRNA(Asn)/glutamyl-tRNA(Gln) amidotransferase subunit C